MPTRNWPQGWAQQTPASDPSRRRGKLASDGGPAGVPKGKRRDTKRRHHRKKR